MNTNLSEARVDNPGWPTAFSMSMASAIVGWVVSQVSVGRRLAQISDKLDDLGQRVSKIEGKLDE